MNAPKRWGVRFNRIPNEVKRMASKAAAYRWVIAERENWQRGARRSQFVTVYVDEQDGRGWTVYEQIDLAEGGAS